jgi:P27 family predicted phage terminase small subunit
MPTPKPTAKELKKLKGNPGKRKINESAPEYQKSKDPAPPEDLLMVMDDRAKAEWIRVVPLLVDAGVLTDVDLTSLANYCIAYSQLIGAQELINLNGLFYTTTTKDGAEMQRKNPMIEVVNLAMRNMLAFASEFGLTPSSRSRLKVEKAPEEDPMENLLKRVK